MSNGCVTEMALCDKCHCVASNLITSGHFQLCPECHQAASPTLEPAVEKANRAAEAVLTGLFYGDSNLTFAASVSRANQVIALMHECGWRPPQ